jgi:hypothetical protein
MKLDAEAVPHSELVEVVVGYCDGDGLLLADARRLGLQIPGRAAAIVAVVIGSEDLNVVLVLDLAAVLVVGIELVGEEVDIAEVSRSVSRVELPRPD